VTEEEIRKIIMSVLHENADMQRDQYDQIVLKTISTILTAFGMDDRDRLEIRADLVHLRQWRKSTETVKKAGWVAILGVIASGFGGMLWLGIKTALGK
jgi:hypothetical protein